MYDLSYLILLSRWMTENWKKLETVCPNSENRTSLWTGNLSGLKPKSQKLFVCLPGQPITPTLDPFTPTPLFQHATLHSNHDPNNFNKFSFPCAALAPSSTTTDSKPRVIATIQPTNQPLSSTAACNYILDPAYPIFEPANTCYYNLYFGRHPSIWEPNASQSSIIAQHISNVDLLLSYTLPSTLPPSSTNDPTFTTWLDDHLPHSIQHLFSTSVLSSMLNASSIFELHLHSQSEHVNNFQCYMTMDHTKVPLTRMLHINLTHPPMPYFVLLHHSTPAITRSSILPSLKTTYSQLNQHITNLSKTDGFNYLITNWFFYAPFFENEKFLCLIIVPASLRCRIFSHFHAGPSGAHMGKYKTLFQIRSRFFWPQLRKDKKTGLSHVLTMLLITSGERGRVNYTSPGL